MTGILHVSRRPGFNLISPSGIFPFATPFSSVNISRVCFLCPAISSPAFCSFLDIPYQSVCKRLMTSINTPELPSLTTTTAGTSTTTSMPASPGSGSTTVVEEKDEDGRDGVGNLLEETRAEAEGDPQVCHPLQYGVMASLDLSSASDLCSSALFHHL